MIMIVISIFRQSFKFKVGSRSKMFCEAKCESAVGSHVMLYTYTQCIFKHLRTYLGCEKPFYIHFKYSIGIALHDRSVQGLYRLHSAHALICNVRFQIPRQLYGYSFFSFFQCTQCLTSDIERFH